MSHPVISKPMLTIIGNYMSHQVQNTKLQQYSKARLKSNANVIGFVNEQDNSLLRLQCPAVLLRHQLVSALPCCPRPSSCLSYGMP